MTQDEIIEMARQSWISEQEAQLITEFDMAYISCTYLTDLVAFAKLVEDAAFKRWAAQTKLAVQDEREACAELCMSLHALTNRPHNYYHFAAKQIRERGEA